MVALYVQWASTKTENKQPGAFSWMRAPSFSDCCPRLGQIMSVPGNMSYTPLPRHRGPWIIVTNPAHCSLSRCCFSSPGTAIPH